MRAHFAEAEDIVSGAPLSEQRYLRACIDEAMRLCPPVPGLLPREVLDGGMDIDGVHFPASTVVGVPAYAIHHNPAYHPEPFKFRPERWMEGEGEGEGEGRAKGGKGTTAEEVQRAQSAFCPFSHGPRGCIGKGVAYLELTVALARLLWLYDLRLVAGEESRQAVDGEYRIKDIFVAEKEGPMVQFRRRAGV